jgi:Rv2525c-like, glycoside hydrolase-like domain
LAFAGFDIARYPGAAVMRALRTDSNLRWVGFYLAVGGPGLDDKRTWMNTYGFLRGIGWGVAPIYLGKQPNSQKLRLKAGHERYEGYMDGLEATNLASDEGMPAGTVIYFDQEIPSEAAPWLAYYLGWVEAVAEQGYRPGIYCSFTIAKALTTFVSHRLPASVPEVWVWNIGRYPANPAYSKLDNIPAPDPAGAGGIRATSWQYVQKSRLTVKGHIVAPVDFDSSAFSDPGQRVISPT